MDSGSTPGETSVRASLRGAADADAGAAGDSVVVTAGRWTSASGAAHVGAAAADAAAAAVAGLFVDEGAGRDGSGEAA